MRGKVGGKRGGLDRQRVTVWEAKRENIEEKKMWWGVKRWRETKKWGKRGEGVRDIKRLERQSYSGVSQLFVGGPKWGGNKAQKSRKRKSIQIKWGGQKWELQKLGVQKSGDTRFRETKLWERTKIVGAKKTNRGKRKYCKWVSKYEGGIKSGRVKKK